MDLSHKADWDSARDRFIAWWGPEMKGPIIQVECPRENVIAASKPAWLKGADPWWWFMDWITAENGVPPDEFFRFWNDHLGTRRFLGDAYPHFWLNFGPGSIAAYLTGILEYSGSTAWFELSHPLPWTEIYELGAEDHAVWWRRTRLAAAAVARFARGRFVVGTADLGGIHDILASLRTTEQLIEDCVEDPDLVTEGALRMVETWQGCHDELAEIIQGEGQDGTSAWMGLWAPGRWYPIQCDFSAMLSPSLFEKLVVPILEAQCDGLDHSIYHWDGPGQIPHLDHLLGIEKLDGIQWVPGAGAAGPTDEKWFPLYERIQKAGKRLVLSCNPAEVEVLLKRLNPDGLALNTWCQTADEGRRLADSLKFPF